MSMMKFTWNDRLDTWPIDFTAVRRRASTRERYSRVTAARDSPRCDVEFRHDGKCDRSGRNRRGRDPGRCRADCGRPACRAARRRVARRERPAMSRANASPFVARVVAAAQFASSRHDCISCSTIAPAARISSRVSSPSVPAHRMSTRGSSLNRRRDRRKVHECADQHALRLPGMVRGPACRWWW